MAEEALSYMPPDMHDEGMTGLFFSAIDGVCAASPRRTCSGVNFVNFGHLDSAR